MVGWLVDTDNTFLLWRREREREERKGIREKGIQLGEKGMKPVKEKRWRTWKWRTEERDKEWEGGKVVVAIFFQSNLPNKQSYSRILNVRKVWYIDNIHNTSLSVRSLQYLYGEDKTVNRIIKMNRMDDKNI